MWRDWSVAPQEKPSIESQVHAPPKDEGHGRQRGSPYKPPGLDGPMEPAPTEPVGASDTSAGVSAGVPVRVKFSLFKFVLQSPILCYLPTRCVEGGF